jgi:uncharacterized protein (TIGR03083 family)
MAGVPPPADPPADLPPLFALERERLLALLAEVGDGEWSRPTPCPGWSVLGLTTHLVGDDLGLLARNRDGYVGTEPPAGLDEDGFVGWIDELQDGWVRAARRLSPRLAVELLAWSGPPLVGVMRAQAPRSRTATVTWAGPDPVPVWLDQARELSEYWIHRQQLLQALGRPSDLRADLAAPVLDGLRWAYPYRLGVGVPDPPPGTTVTIEVAGPVTTAWHLVADGTGWAFHPSPAAAGPPVARLALTTEQAWRLLTNNLPPDERSRLRADGEPHVVDVLLATRAIIGTPK